jgi:hypothetical protein
LQTLFLENARMPLFVPTLRRGATSLVCAGISLAVATTPVMAQASQPLPTAVMMPTGLSPTAAKLRTIMSLTQEPTEAPAADTTTEAPAGDATTDTAVAEAPAPVAEGPAPAPAPAPSGPPPKMGLGMMITGAVITGSVALPMIASGTYTLVSGRYVDDGTGDVEVNSNIVGGAVLAFGLISLAVGVPLLAVGAHRFKKWRKWKNGQQVQWAPSMNRTAHGTFTTGVALRF